MVFSISSDTETLPKPMATEKPNPLHNFSMPVLKWGNRRLLRCMKVNPNGQIPITSPDRRSPPSDVDSASPNRSGFRKPSTPSLLDKLRNPQPNLTTASSDLGIEEIRAKLLDHLHTAADRMQYKVPEEREDVESYQPWNLRTRRAVLKALAENGGGGGSAAAADYLTRSRLRGSAAAQMGEKEEKKEKRKFSVLLSREEIEKDFLAMTGLKPARRPKKRVRILQRQLDGIFPGLWLSEITLDTYKVSDVPESGKR